MHKWRLTFHLPSSKPHNCSFAKRCYIGNISKWTKWLGIEPWTTSSRDITEATNLFHKFCSMLLFKMYVREFSSSKWLFINIWIHYTVIGWQFRWCSGRGGCGGLGIAIFTSHPLYSKVETLPNSNDKVTTST